MATNVIVLVPDGHRSNIKVTPNTTILQILEEACSKHGLEPQQFDIKHHKKVLDTTITIRFSGLPNNALLELIEATGTRKEAEVTLLVQLEDGQRLTGAFLPSNNIWEVLTCLCPNHIAPEKHPVVIYMRQEIFGVDNFISVTLKSLGIMGGRAMMRLVHREPETLQTQANVSAPLPVKPVEEKPYVRRLIKNESEGEPVKPVVPEPNTLNKPPPPLPLQEQISPPPPPRKQQRPNENYLDAIRQEKQKQTGGIKTKNITSNEAKKVPAPSSKKEARKASSPPRDDFVFLGDRNAMVFSLETSESVRSDDLPDDFFELSISDIKKLFRDIKKKRMELEQGGHLMTSAMRQLEQSKKQLRTLNQYKRAVIRIEFPTRVVLQGIFVPTETIDDVMKFVRDYLADKNLNFHLFTTPPKQILPKEARLIEVDCVPGALLHFGCDTKHATYLKTDILTQLSGLSEASLAASQIRRESTRHLTTFEDDNFSDIMSTDINVGASTSAGPTSTSKYEDYDKKPITSPPEKVPKWFKPSK